MKDDAVDKAVAFLNDQNAAIWSIPPELLPDYLERNPAKAKMLVKSTEDVAEIAAKLGQWDALHQAVRFLIACQQAVLDWWGNNVRSQAGEKSPVRGISVAQAEKTIGFSDSLISRWKGALKAPEKYAERLVEHARRNAGLEPEHNRVSPNSGVQQWFTPAQYIEAAREVMQGIDLDPASHPLAQEVVQAVRWFGPDNDGLVQPWQGRVWLNPPYSFPLIEKFARKLVDEYRAGAVSEAIMLTNNCTDTGWFHYAERDALSLCFTLGRINFYGPDGIGEAPLQGQAFFYYGHQGDVFARVFGAFGFIR